MPPEYSNFSPNPLGRCSVRKVMIMKTRMPRAAIANQLPLNW